MTVRKYISPFLINFVLISYKSGFLNECADVDFLHKLIFRNWNLLSFAKFDQRAEDTKWESQTMVYEPNS